MVARGYFERLRDDSAELDERRAKVLELRARLGVSGHRYGSIGGSGARDASAPIDRIIEMERELESDQARHDLEVEQATSILYGRSGHGGLARARSLVDADIICCHYLQGMAYAEIASALELPESSNPAGWCRVRAHRALAYVDEVGVDVLADS